MQKVSKGAITRQKIIDTFVEMLDECPVWEIKVTTLTRRIGISSQLLYVHFKSLEDILFAQSETILQDNPDLTGLIAGNWEGVEGFERAVRIVEEILGFWNKHRTVMKVIGTLDDAHNARFAHFRTVRADMAAQAFKQIIDRQIAAGLLSRDLNGDLAARYIVSRLHVFGGDYPVVLAAGFDHDEAVKTTALMTQSSLGFANPVVSTAAAPRRRGAKRVAKNSK